MKKNTRMLLVALVLTVATILLVMKNNNGTIDQGLKDFAVSDTTSITKIFLADKNNHYVTLTKQPQGNWTVNEKYKVRPDGIKTILSTIKNLAVKTRVAKAAYDGVIKGLASGGIKCEIYQQGEEKPMKVYYVGGSTADVLGTFMLLENSNLPFVIEIPGFQGYLTPRYSPLIENWRDRAIFDYTPDEIKKIEVNYFQAPSKSFVIENSAGHFIVTSPETGKRIQNPDTLALFNYMTFFKYLCFENWDKGFTQRQQDSLKATWPLNSITITDVSGKITRMINYPKPITQGSLAQTDSLGRPLKYDLDKLVAFINDGNDFVLVQYHVFGKLFRQYDDFDLDGRNSGSKKAGH